MSPTNPNQQEHGATKGRNAIIIAFSICAVVVIALLVTVIVLLTRSSSVAPEVSAVTDKRATIVTPENVEAVKEKEKEPVVAGMYFCTMNTEWHFKDSASPSYDAYVLNSTDNSHTVYFDLFLKDTEKLVYSSPYMEVGAQLDELTLTEPLSAGEYPAIVTYHLVDEQHETLSTVSVTVTLYVEN